ncbi:glycosyltransferase family 39 protein [Candidatus Woesearchaeota archaeon]|nr:glycosyltransferase family 39 protein [Candidatus Woesearchaeota archaeon]
MEIKKHVWVLVAIFLIVLGTRLFFAFSTPYFSSSEAYFNLKEIGKIGQTGLPSFHDDLSFSGKTNIYLPTFHYIIAFFAIFMPLTLAAKLIPNIAAACLVFVVFLLAKKFTKNNKVSLLTAFISGFIPIFFRQTINSISVYSFIIPLLFLAFYFFMQVTDNKKYLPHYLFLMVLLTFLYPTMLLFIFALVIYLIFMLIERTKLSRSELEISLFSSFFAFWFYFIFFKKALLMHGINIIWQNIPAQLLRNYFVSVNMLEAIYKIGVIPFICGVYIIYRYLLKEKNRQIYLLTAFAISVSLLLWLRSIQLDIGLIFLSVTLLVLFSQFYKDFIGYIEKTKFAKYENYMFLSVVFLLVVSSVIPSLSYAYSEIKNAPSADEINAFLWLKSNTPEGSVILASVNEGTMINAISKRKNVIDTNFLMVKNSAEIFDDVKSMFTTNSEITALELLNKYKVNYMLFSEEAKNEFKIKDLNFIEERCFELVYNQSVQIYMPLCAVEEK